MQSSGTFISDLVKAIEREPALDKWLAEIAPKGGLSAEYANGLINARRACAEWLASLVDPDTIPTEIERALLVAGMRHRMMRVLIALATGLEINPCTKDFLRKGK